jgi:simple sugar transport system substrate-binding protein
MAGGFPQEGVLFAYQYAKYGLAPVGAVSTGPAIIDKHNIAKILQVSKQYPGILGAS